MWGASMSDKIINIIRDAERLALITRRQIGLVNGEIEAIEEEEHEHSARAFNQHRRAYGTLSTATILQFRRLTP